MELKELQKILKALANKRRLAILRFIKKKGEANVSVIKSVVSIL